MQHITLTRPDDWHSHLRDAAALAAVAPFTARQFGRAIIMPNLKPPVTTVKHAQDYRQQVLAACRDYPHFQPLMTLYLTDNTTVQDIEQAVADEHVVAVKYYPAGATTNSDSGVTDFAKVYDCLAAMERTGLPLLCHGEVTDADIDIFDREKVFIDRHLSRILKDFPNLRVVLEHITTADAVDFVLAAGDKLAATITPQHLMLNRNAMLVGGIQPHHYCLPVIKRERHRQRLVDAAISGNPKFFLGTDTAPHARQAKESACGCAGIFSAHAAIELYADVFDTANALDRLEAFASFYGADFYGLPRNQEQITLRKQPWQIPDSYPLADDSIIPFMAGKTLAWKYDV